MHWIRPSSCPRWALDPPQALLALPLSPPKLAAYLFLSSNGGPIYGYNLDTGALWRITTGFDPIMPVLRTAIVGVGWAGRRHIEAIRELNRKITVSCLVDNDAEHLSKVAAEAGVERTYTEYADALSDPQIDAVSICTPHALHCPMAIAAAEAGKHVLCEKPMAVSVGQATCMIEAAEAGGVTLFVAENVAYGARAKFLRNVLDVGRHSDYDIGEPTHALVTRGFAAQRFGYPGRRAWLAEPEQGGSGAWLLQGIHTVAEVRAIFVPICGEVETVYAREHKAASFVRRGLEGTVSALLTFENGLCVSLLQTSETRLPGNLKAVTVHGDRGSLRATTDVAEYFAAGADEPERIEYPVEPLSTYAQEMEAFADAVAGESEGITSGRSERHSLAIVEAGYESMRSGRPVHLPSHFGDLGSA